MSAPAPTAAALSRNVDRVLDWVIAGAAALSVLLEAWLLAPDTPTPYRGGRHDDHDDIPGIFVREPWHTIDTGHWILVVLAAGATAIWMLTRRRYPTVAAAGMGITAALTALGLNLPIAVTVAFGLALYTVAADRGWIPAILTGALASLIVLAGAASAEESGGALLVAAFVVVVVLVPLLAAAVTRSRRAYLQEVEARLAQAQTEQVAVAAQAVSEERVRLARDLHDVLAHSLTVVNLQVGVASHLVRDHPDRAEQALAEARQAGAAAVDELRTTLALMRGDQPESRTPVPSVADIPELVRAVAATGLRVELVDDIDPRQRITEVVGLVAYRLVQEGLTNVVRHAGLDARARVTVRADGDWLLVDIADGGGSAPPTPGSGLGLPGLADRVHALGGTFAAGPLSQGGFRITAHLPLTTTDLESS